MSTCLPSAVILPTGEDERVLYSEDERVASITVRISEGASQ